MRWFEYRETLPAQRHRRLVLAAGAGLREARLASELLHDDGELVELRAHIETAIGWLQEARDLLGGAESHPGA